MSGSSVSRMDDELPDRHVDRPDRPETPLKALAVFANIVERADIEIGVTMAVSGTWVSGMLISTRRYFDAMTGAIAAQATDQIGRDLAEGLSVGLEATVAAVVARPEEERGHGPELYLRRARLWVGESRIDDVVMAVRTDRVDAFWVGNPFVMPAEDGPAEDRAGDAARRPGAGVGGAGAS